MYMYLLHVYMFTHTHTHTHTAEFSKAQHSFATALSNFKFQSIGGETQAEKMISTSLS